jgi:hypothetical protein
MTKTVTKKPMASKMAKKAPVKRKKKAVQPESSWFNKSVFYSVCMVALASTVTACSLLTQKIDATNNKPVEEIAIVETVNTDIILDNPNVIVTRLPETIIVEDKVQAHTHGENGAALMKQHIEQYHNYSETETVFKCHNLNGKIFSCKVILIEDVEQSNLSQVDKEAINEAVVEVVKEEEKKKSIWNPFR